MACVDLCYDLLESDIFQVEVRQMKAKVIPWMIRETRTAMGLTQEQFVTRVGEMFSMVNCRENGRSRPSPFALSRIREMQTELPGQ